MNSFDDDDNAIADGWGEDDVDVLLSRCTDVNTNITHGLNTNDYEEEEEDGWNDNWDFDDKSVDTEESKLGGNDDNDNDNIIDTDMDMDMDMDSNTRKLISDLFTYVDFLTNDNRSKLVDSINRTLDTKCNSMECAFNLCRYYHERPNLCTYTLESELKRMEYMILLPSSSAKNYSNFKSTSSTNPNHGILTVPSDIQTYFKSHPVDNLVDEMLLRASNQSILADIFPVLTGFTNHHLIQSQFMSTAVATKCKFIIDMSNGDTSISNQTLNNHNNNNNNHIRKLHVDCNLQISIPTTSTSKQIPSNNKLNLADVWLTIDFSPEPASPYVKYQILRITPCINIHSSHGQECIRIAALTLNELPPPHLPHDSDNTNTTRLNDSIRDHFLQSIMNTQTGLKLAFQDLDNVVNVSGKFKRFAAALPTLPSVDDIRWAGFDEPDSHYRIHDDDDDDDNAIHSNHALNQKSDSKNDSLQNKSDANNPQPKFSPSSSSLPKPQQSGNHMNRPQPILSNLLKSGLSHLSKVAALPDVDYDEFTDLPPNLQIQSNSIIPKLYRSDHDLTTAQHNERQIPPNSNPGKNESYNRLDNSNLSKKTNSGCQDANTFMVEPKLTSIDPDMHDDSTNRNFSDGWSDEDVNIISDDEFQNNQNVNITKNTLETKKEDSPLLHSTTSVSKNSSIDDATTTINKKSEGVFDDYHEVTEDELEMKALLETFVKIVNTNVCFEDQFTVPDDFVFDSSTGIIPTRTRFIPRSQNLNINI